MFTRGPLVVTGDNNGRDEKDLLRTLVGIYAVYEGFNLNPSRLFNIRQHYLV